ncbi:MAG: hypothetical protein II956_03770 [Bacteroidales bacterium]|nr:hypothetical protein [Bacteroidales bacterium]
MTQTTAIIVGNGGYAVNEDILEISEPIGANYFEYSHGNIPNNPGVRVKNIALCGLAALEDNPDYPGEKKLADSAVLINRGVIDIHFDKIYALYKSRKSDPMDTDFDTVRCYAMAAGADSMLVNEGTINVYMDNDIDARVSLYGCALWANARSLMINKGEINFIGNGSYQSYIRGIGSMDSHLQCINDGVVNVKLQRAYQTRILHTAGSFGSLINNGKINVDTTGRIMVLGSLMGTSMVNNGEITIEDHAVWLKNIVPYHYQFDPLATVFYEHFPANDLPCRPTVNHGKIKINVRTSEETGDNAVAFAYFVLQIGENGKYAVHTLENDGEIVITQQGCKKAAVAEVGINIQTMGNNPTKVKLGKWTTSNRDFNTTYPIVLHRSAALDLSDMQLTDFDDKPLSTDGIVKQLN